MSKHLTPDKVLVYFLLTTMRIQAPATDTWMMIAAIMFLQTMTTKKTLFFLIQSMIPSIIMTMTIMQQLEMRMTETLQTRLLRSSNQKVVKKAGQQNRYFILLLKRAKEI